MSTDATSGSEASAQAGGALDISDVSRRLVEEPFNTGSFELLDQFVATDCVNHDPGTPAELRDLHAAEQIKRTTTMYRAAFPDVRMTVEDVIAAGDKVALRWH